MSTLRSKCPHCDNRLQYSDAQVGKRVKCQKCGNAFRLPEPNSPSAVEVKPAPQAPPSLPHSPTPIPAPPLAIEAPEARVCCVCKGSVGIGDRYAFSGYKKRTKGETEYGLKFPLTVTTRTEYFYEGVYNGEDFVCPNCIDASKRFRWKMIGLGYLLWTGFIIWFACLDEQAVKKDMKVALWIGIVLCTLFGLATFSLCSRSTIAYSLIFRHNRKLRAMGLRGLGPGRLG